MIRTGCVYAPKKPTDGLRVLVSRKWPRGVAKEHVDVWWPQLAPSLELLADWREGKITWPEYDPRFVEEMTALPSMILMTGIEAVMDGAELNCEPVTITLLCVERGAEGEEESGGPLLVECHRRILARLFNG